MKWKKVFLWAGLGLAIWIVLSTFAGLIFGLLNPQASEQAIVFALAGMMIPFLVVIGSSPLIFGILTLLIVIWVMFVKRFPGLEINKQRLLLSLGSYTLIIGVIVWWLFPLDRSLAPIGSFLAIFSLLLPRFLTRKLSPGVFAA